MNDQQGLKILFIINPGSGTKKVDWPLLIKEYFETRPHTIELFEIASSGTQEQITQKISQYKPDRVVAVGGDGTVSLIAKSLLGTETPLAVLPAGSANGMAAELQLPKDPVKTIEVCVTGKIKKIHLVKLNDQLCIHLADLGFNAFVVKRFEAEKKRGMWGYVKASWRVLRNQPLMHLTIKMGGNVFKRDAKMLVVANGTRYGSGAVINPAGKMDDNVFEVVLVKKISFIESFKMFFTHASYNPEKTEVIQTDMLEVQTRHHYHFQVDGEYLGKVRTIRATIIMQALNMIIPPEETTGN